MSSTSLLKGLWINAVLTAMCYAQTSGAHVPAGQPQSHPAHMQTRSHAAQPGGRNQSILDLTPHNFTLDDVVRQARKGSNQTAVSTPKRPFGSYPIDGVGLVPEAPWGSPSIDKDNPVMAAQWNQVMSPRNQARQQAISQANQRACFQAGVNCTSAMNAAIHAYTTKGHQVKDQFRHDAVIEAVKPLQQ
jgi:hypothetical protein